MLQFLQMAAGVALPSDVNDSRNFWLGAIGVRQDGAIVSSRNGATHFSTKVANYQLIPNSHAEGRCLRKAGKYSTLYVARVLRKDMSLALSFPCKMCRVRISSFKIKKVYFTIDNNHYGIWYPNNDKIIYHND